MTRTVRHALLRRLRPLLPVRRLPLLGPAGSLNSAGPPWSAFARILRRLFRVALGLAAVALFIGGFLALALWSFFTASLPPLDGVVAVHDGLSAPVRIERDELGIPSIHAASRTDVAFATGFVHGQDRFFQMDILRRHAAGELCELFGRGVVDEDKRMRLHRFRSRARRTLKSAPLHERDLFRAYTQGVAAGLASLRKPPWEYLLLRAEPVPWREEDTILVALTMYQMLQQGAVAHERACALTHDLLPEALAKFLWPPGSTWDAPLLGPALPPADIPGPDQLDLRRRPVDWTPPPVPPIPLRVRPGSNNWAVHGSRTAHGGAIVANDMHLGLLVPNIWYRAAFHWGDGEGRHRVVGVTLPGTPAMITGSNTHIAWGFTNSEGDYADLVLLEDDSEDPRRYRTPAGPRLPVPYQETIRAGGRDVYTVVEETIWGPIVDRDHRGRRRALRWVAHEVDAVNLGLMRLETACSVEEALQAAPLAGTPAQNLVVADARGHIAWTILGRIPRRVGFDGQTPVSWADGQRRWDGWLPAGDYPRVIDPPAGILWTANNRTAGEPWLSRLGRHTYDVGARARQIRDDLLARPRPREDDMLAVQLDDRAIFLARWQALLVETLSSGAVRGDPRRQALLREVRSWGERAAVESVGFRIVVQFRNHVRNIVLASLTAPCLRADPRFSAGDLGADVEDSVWQLVTKRPAHLLPPGHASWEALLLNAADRIAGEIQSRRADFEQALAAYTWGEVNRPRIRHPFGPALGPLAGLFRLDMPREPLPGGRSMPRIQTPTFGASQRMAVSPGREEEGYFHMPTGQSGHPASPHYRDAHAAWAQGKATPFLPGATRHTLELRPGE